MIKHVNYFLNTICLWAAIAVCLGGLIAGLCMVVYAVYDAAMNASIMLDTLGL